MAKAKESLGASAKDTCYTDSIKTKETTAVP